MARANVSPFLTSFAASTIFSGVARLSVPTSSSWPHRFQERNSSLRRCISSIVSFLVFSIYVSSSSLAMVSGSKVQEPSVGVARGRRTWPRRFPVYRSAAESSKPPQAKIKSLRRRIAVTGVQTQGFEVCVNPLRHPAECFLIGVLNGNVVADACEHLRDAMAIRPLPTTATFPFSMTGTPDSNSKSLATPDLCLLDPAQDPFGRCRQLIHMDTERFQGVVDGRRHGGRGYHAAPFPATLYPVYRVRGRRLVVPDDHLGNLHGGRDQVVLVAGVRQSTLFVVDELLEERGADPLGGATDYLAGQ